MPHTVRRIDVARQAVHLACDVCRSVQRKLADVGTLRKSDRSPVTVADFAAQAVVAHTLGEAFGPVALVAEEDSGALRELVDRGERELVDQVVQAVQPAWPGATLDDVLDTIDMGASEGQPEHASGFWTLDPIDGTKGFLRGQQYAVSLAWIEHGTPIIGLLGCPNLSSDFNRPFADPDTHGTLYMALVGEGMYEVPADDPEAQATRIHRLEPLEGEPLRLCESVEGAHTSHSRAARVMDRLGELADPCRLDGQGKYAVVGRGQADVYLRLPRGDGYIERIWDHAAGVLIASETGCAVTDVRGDSLDFGCGRGLERNRGIVVAMPELHGRVLAALADSPIDES